MTHRRLSVKVELQALKWLLKFQEDLTKMLGASKHRYSSIDIVQSAAGPGVSFVGDHATVIVGPNAASYEPTFIANLAHESVHLFEGTRGNASGLEEGFAVHFELDTIEKRYGVKERAHFLKYLPRSYCVASSDYIHLLSINADAAKNVRDSFGALTGFSLIHLRRLFPMLSLLRSYRLARRMSMR